MKTTQNAHQHSLKQFLNCFAYLCIYVKISPENNQNPHFYVYDHIIILPTYFMKYIKIIFIATLTFFSNISFAQDEPTSGALGFRERIYDFGTLEEDMRFATHRFVFKNTGTTPIKILNVETSCGCTTPTWSENTIKPGDSGFVDARYETTNRLGTFDKTITVYSNSKVNPIQYLNIKGNVIRPQPTTIGAPLPNIGNLQTDLINLTFDPLLDNQILKKEFRLSNNSDFTATIQPLGPSSIPDYISIEGFPQSLEPGESQKVTVTIDGNKVPSYGFGGFEIPVISNSYGNFYLGVNVSYNRKQFFPTLSAKKLKKAAKLVVTPTAYNFGEVPSGDYLNGYFDFKNEGKSPLTIHQMVPDCPCITLTVPKTTLAPGETMRVKFLFDTVTKNGKKGIGIWIVSNDPIQPERNIWVQATFPEIKKRQCADCKF